MVDNNLLQYHIHNVTLNIKTTAARVSKSGEPVQSSISGRLEKGEFDIQTKLGELNIDTYDARASVGMGGMNCLDLMRKLAGEGRSKAVKGSKEVVHEGEKLSHLVKPAEIAREKMDSEAVTRRLIETVFLPNKPAEVSVGKSDYSADIGRNRHISNHENTDISTLKYVPAEVDVNSEGRAHVEFEYIGGHLYVPPSAKEKFER